MSRRRLRSAVSRSLALPARRYSTPRRREGTVPIGKSLPPRHPTSRSSRLCNAGSASCWQRSGGGGSRPALQCSRSHSYFTRASLAVMRSESSKPYSGPSESVTRADHNVCMWRFTMADQAIEVMRERTAAGADWRRMRVVLLLSPVLALAYPFLLQGFNASVTAILSAGGGFAAWSTAAVTLILAFAIPALALLAAMSLAAIEMPTAAQRMARHIAVLAVATPPSFVF